MNADNYRIKPDKTMQNLLAKQLIYISKDLSVFIKILSAFIGGKIRF